MNTIKLIQGFDPQEVFNKICSETVETVAQIILCMEAPNALIVFEKFSLDVQISVCIKIAETNKVTPQELDTIHKIVSDQFPEIANEKGFEKNGIDTVMDLFFLSLNSDINKVIFHLRKNNPELYDSIFKKAYVFEDFFLMKNDEIKKIFSEINIDELALALKDVDSIIQEKIFCNIPSKKANSIKKKLKNREEMDDTDSRTMQYKIITHIKDLKKQEK